MAVDGVAPRAKMNQQRSRRFRSAKEAEVTAAEIIARNKGQEMDMLNKKRFDSNCITPGTDFLLKLNMALQKWVEFKMETDPFWKDGADVIVSGPDVPGEGEHKVMDFIRETREIGESVGGDSPYWKPNYTHVLYGLDADLIMLGLVTHEPEFMLLREKMSVVMAGRGRNKFRKKKDMLEYTKNDFEILELAALRQMLAIQFRKFADEGQLGVEFEIERVIDDFIFMCMLVGNDFMPHCPHLEIDGGALSLMMSNYVDLLPVWGGYLSKREKIHPKRFEQFMSNLAVYEEEHFKRRGYEENESGFKLESSEEQEDEDFYGTHYSGKATPAAAAAAHKKGGVAPAKENVSFEASGSSGNRAFRRMHPTSKARSYRDFYYETKLDWKVEDRSRTLYERRALVREYMEGLHWNLNYYHNGCQSWDWFFPGFYAPLATDIVNLSEFYTEVDEEGFSTFEFEQTEPIPSLAQLLSVLPPQSADLLPKPLAELMLHPSSPIKEYYPPDFTVDPNGKRQSWEAIVQIPFIDSKLLLDTVNQVIEADDAGKELFTNAERRRNMRGKDHTFVAPGATEEEREALAIAKRKNTPVREQRPRNDRAGEQQARRSPPRNRRPEGSSPRNRRPEGSSPPNRRPRESSPPDRRPKDSP